MNLFKTHTATQIGTLVRQFCAQYDVAFVALNDPDFLAFVTATKAEAEGLYEDEMVAR